MPHWQEISMITCRLFRSTDPVFDSAEICLRNDSVEPENLQADIDKAVYDLDLQELESFKKQHSNHLFLAYLNINSLRNKIWHNRDIAPIRAIFFSRVKSLKTYEVNVGETADEGKYQG